MVIYGSSDNDEVLHDDESDDDVKLVEMKIIVVFFFNILDFVLLQPWFILLSKECVWRKQWRPHDYLSLTTAFWKRLMSTANVW